MKKSVKISIAAAVFVIAVGYLFISGFKSESVYYLTVSEVQHNPEKFNRKGMRVSGDVVPGTVTKDFKNQYLEFHIADPDGKSMKVIYKGIIPDTFKEDIQVIVEGKFDRAENVFKATTVLTKCPSKYEVKVEKS